MEQVQGLHRGKLQEYFNVLSSNLQAWPGRPFPKTLQNLDYNDNSHHNVQSTELTIKSYTSRCLRKTTVNPPGGLLCCRMIAKTEEIACALGAGYEKRRYNMITVCTTSKQNVWSQKKTGRKCTKVFPEMFLAVTQ